MGFLADFVSWLTNSPETSSNSQQGGFGGSFTGPAMSALNGVSQYEADKLTRGMLGMPNRAGSLEEDPYSDLLLGSFFGSDFNQEESGLRGLSKGEANKTSKAMMFPLSRGAVGRNAYWDALMNAMGYGEDSSSQPKEAEQGDVSDLTKTTDDKLRDMGYGSSTIMGLGGSLKGESSGRDGGGTPDKAGNAPNSQPTVNAPAEEPEESSPATYLPYPPMDEYGEYYQTWKDHPELVEKYGSEYTDENNYGYSRARASGNGELWADLALANPRIMQRMKNSGIDTEDIEHLAENIYKYMYVDNLIDIVDYYNGVNDFLGYSDNDVIDMLGFLHQESNYDFDPNFKRRYELDDVDAQIQGLVRNAYSGAASEYDLDRVSELMRRSGYLTDDEYLTWGNSSDPWWVDNNKNRESLPKYGSLRDTEYLDPQTGVYDTNAPLSLSDAMALADADVLGKDGKPLDRRLVVASKNNKKNSKNSADDTVYSSIEAASSLGYY